MNAILVVLTVCAFFFDWAKIGVLGLGCLKIVIEIIGLLITIRGLLRLGGVSLLLRAWKGAVAAIRFSFPLAVYFVVGSLVAVIASAMLASQFLSESSLSVESTWLVTACLALGLTLALHVSEPVSILFLANSTADSVRLELPEKVDTKSLASLCLV